MVIISVFGVIIYMCVYIYCKVTIFKPSPLQWICREWVQKLGSDKATACFEGEKHTKSGSPMEKGPLARGRESPTPLSHTRASFLSLGLSLLLGRLPPFSLGDLCCYIFLSSVYPPPTLVSHPCLSSSARPIGHSFWRSVSCCGPHRLVQGSHPHQWGQGVSCGYLIRRWLLLLGLSLHHSPMASPYDLESLFAILEWIALSDIAFFSPMILACRGEGHPRQYNLVVWISFIRPRALLPPRRGPWAWYQMGRSPQILWPHNLCQLEMTHLTQSV